MSRFVMMFGVGRLAGNAHRKIRHHGRAKVDQRMGGFRQDCERAARHADDGLCHRQTR